MSAVLLSRSGQLTRRFSNGQLLLKLPQTEGTVSSTRSSDSWILRSAILLSFLGFGFSAFSTQKLCDTSKHKTPLAFLKKS